MFAISVAAGTAGNTGGATALGAGPSASVDVLGPQPTLEPGPGFDGPTPEPPAIGTGPGSDAKAIARWDVVPYQTFDGIFQIGVVAFHINGIDRVEFSLEGGPWTAAMPVMTRNPLTDVVEYWVNLDASLLPDGPIEIRAIAYPTVGIPRVLDGPMNRSTLRGNGEFSLCLNSNGNGTQNGPIRYVSVNGDDVSGTGSPQAPFQTIFRAAHSMVSGTGSADGGIVYLYPGEYLYGTESGQIRNHNRWLTIMPYPGTPQGSAKIIGYGTRLGLRTALVHLKDLEIRPSIQEFELLGSDDSDDYLWIDRCSLIGHNRMGWWSQRTSWSGQFMTDTTVKDFRDGIVYHDFARNCRVQTIASDAYTGTPVVINCTAEDVDRQGDTDIHPDIYQVHMDGSSLENGVVYGLRAHNFVAQGIFAAGVPLVQDTAFVNIIIDFADNDLTPLLSQWNVTSEHVLLWYITFHNQVFLWRHDVSQINNFSIKGCVFEKLQVNAGATFDDNWFQSNHYIDAASWLAITPGYDASTGYPDYMNVQQHDFRPRKSSPLAQRIAEPNILVDAMGATRSRLTSVGALAAEGECNDPPSK
ncbi:MAG: hypothetical protein IT366_11645 [Candidatus Hydrogenedentes bacterium]|nr:hypothetical protein [Candidatus Hydrogenedentota bacterium]